MKNYVFLSEKLWHDEIFSSLSKRGGESWVRISNKQGFTNEALIELKPEFIFIPHWSHIIPEIIWENFKCVVFHMTDLPYGRGGSPLQNLIVRGYTKTKISALQVDGGIDTGDVYCKSDLSLTGTASEIFERSAPIIKEMIERIIEEQIVPSPQVGESVQFKRRTIKDGKLNELLSLKEVYDYIRMLDADGYPSAFLETEHLIIKFENAKFIDTTDLEIHANVKISKK
jgi:methionyl-tRNA formyltransferase